MQRRAVSAEAASEGEFDVSAGQSADWGAVEDEDGEVGRCGA